MDTGNAVNNVNRRPRKTILLYGLAFSLMFAVLAGRLVQLQLSDREKLQNLARNQHTARRDIPPFRGPILDCRNRPLALDVESFSIFADPYLINQTALDKAAAEHRSAVAPAADGQAADELAQSLHMVGEAERIISHRWREVSEQLAPALDMSAEEIRGEISRCADGRFVWLKRRVDKDVRDRVLSLKIRGIGIQSENKRHYPSEGLAAQVIGSVGIDNQGVSAMEHYLDARLRGESGNFVAELDGKRRQVWIRPGAYQSAEDGQIVVLTIDLTIQSFVEEALAETVEHFQARGGSAIVMDPQTGAILALANYPTFNPYNYANSDEYARRNRLLTDPIEPGSTIKSLIAAAALDMGVVRRGQVIFCENGSWRINGRTVRDVSSYGDLTFEQGVARSSNIFMAKLAELMGNERLHRGLKNFGIGSRTGVLMPGEAPGLLYPLDRWSNMSRVSVAMGYELLVTPLQMVTAFSALANGGRLMQPRMIQKVCASDGSVVADLSEAVEISRPVSQETADYMRRVVLRGTYTDPRGTAKRLDIPGYEPFGKTGTAKKRNPNGGGYSSDLYVGSFIGAAPLENPRLVCMVMIDEPDRSIAYYGGSVAGPAVKQILERSLAYLRVPPIRSTNIADSGR